jgi:hypothetical protein
VEPRSPRRVRARRNDLDGDERWTTIPGEEGSGHSSRATIPNHPGAEPRLLTPTWDPAPKSGGRVDHEPNLASMSNR